MRTHLAGRSAGKNSTIRFSNGTSIKYNKTSFNKIKNIIEYDDVAVNKLRILDSFRCLDCEHAMMATQYEYDNNFFDKSFQGAAREHAAKMFHKVELTFLENYNIREKNGMEKKKVINRNKEESIKYIKQTPTEHRMSGVYF